MVSLILVIPNLATFNTVQFNDATHKRTISRSVNISMKQYFAVLYYIAREM